MLVPVYSDSDSLKRPIFGFSGTNKKPVWDDPVIQERILVEISWYAKYGDDAGSINAVLGFTGATGIGSAAPPGTDQEMACLTETFIASSQLLSFAPYPTHPYYWTLNGIVWVERCLYHQAGEVAGGIDIRVSADRWHLDASTFLYTTLFATVVNRGGIVPVSISPGVRAEAEDPATTLVAIIHWDYATNSVSLKYRKES